MPRNKNQKYDAVKRASANRINLLEHATGDLFCVLDGDDFYSDTRFIEDAIEIFNKNKDVSIVAFGYRFLEYGKLSEEKKLPFGMGHVDKNKYISGLYVPAGACVHKKIWNNERVEYIKSIGYYDDNNIVINGLNYGEMFFCDRSIYVYRQTGSSIYTSMNFIEQSVLNVQGLDVDLQLIDDEYRCDIFRRYSGCVITMYIWRKKIKGILGQSKYDMYLSDCKKIKNSICYKLLLHEDNDDFDKKTVTKLIQKNMLFFIKMKVKYALLANRKCD
jgi:hypothetical protein